LAYPTEQMLYMNAGNHILAGAMWCGTDAKTAEDGMMTGVTSARAEEGQNSHSAPTANKVVLSKTCVATSPTGQCA